MREFSGFFIVGAINAALDNQRKAQRVPPIELQKPEAQARRERGEEEARRKQQQLLREQAKREREAAFTARADKRRT